MNTIESVKIIFISWAYHVPRSKGIANALKARDFYIEYMKGWPLIFLPIRYLLQSLKTFTILISERPEIVITMNPPILLPLLAFVYSRFANAFFVIDSHTGAFLGKWKRFIALHRFLSKRALATVVTNKALQTQVDAWGARAVVLEDRLPALQSIGAPFNVLHPSVCVINSFSDDEPLRELLEASACVKECTFYITGKVPSKKSSLVNVKTSNVVLTGFLPEDEYIGLIKSVDVIIVLVKNDHTMLCGAYEAVAAEKPLVTSNWPVLKQYFSQGTIYVDNTPYEIERAVRKALEQRVDLQEEMKELKAKLTKQWSDRFSQFLTLITGEGKL